MAVDGVCMKEPLEAPENELSPAQARFAQKNHAVVGMRSVNDTGMVYLYEQRPGAVYRWLVKQNGHAVELHSFTDVPRKASRSPTPEQAEGRLH
jgi:hypothetical protein